MLNSSIKEYIEIKLHSVYSASAALENGTASAKTEMQSDFSFSSICFTDHVQVAL